MAKEYLLMKRNKQVASIVFNSRWEIAECFERRSGSIPEGPFMCYADKKLNSGLLNRWFKARMISNMRPQYKALKNHLCMEYLQEAAVDGLGLSLFDSYWIKPDNFPKSWEEVNLFTHSYPNDLSISLADPNYDGFVKPGPNPSLFIPGHYNYVFECSKMEYEGPDRQDPGKRSNFLFCFEDEEYVITEKFLNNDCAPLFGLKYLHYSDVHTKEQRAIASPIFTSDAVSFIPANLLILGKNGNYNQMNSQEPFNLIHFVLKNMGETYNMDAKDCLSSFYNLLLFDTLFQVSDRQLFHFGYLVDEMKKKISLGPVMFSGRGLGHSSEVMRNKKCLYPTYRFGCPRRFERASRKRRALPSCCQEFAPRRFPS